MGWCKRMKELPVEYYEKQLQEIIDSPYQLTPHQFRTYAFLKRKIARMKVDKK